MTAVVFYKKKHTIHVTSPKVDTVPKGAIMCVLGPTRQKWYAREPRGWRQFEGYQVSKRLHPILKMVCLATGIPFPTNTSVQPWHWASI